MTLNNKRQKTETEEYPEQAYRTSYSACFIVGALYCLMVLALCLISCVYAAPHNADREYSEHQFSEKQRIESVIATGELNRIHLNHNAIVEIIGDESKYNIYWSGDYQNLFILPKVEIGETIDISLVMSGGRVQDMRFIVGDCTARTISINLNTATSQASSGLDGGKFPYAKLKHEVDLMMRAMSSGDAGKYYVIDINRTLAKSKQLLIKQSTAYRYKELAGAIISVQNNSSKPITIKDADIRALFQNIVAINIPDNLLPTKSSTEIFVITKLGNENV